MLGQRHPYECFPFSLTIINVTKLLKICQNAKHVKTHENVKTMAIIYLSKRNNLCRKMYRKHRNSNNLCRNFNFFQPSKRNNLCRIEGGGAKRFISCFINSPGKNRR